jgi:hypothetical protein
MRFRSSLLSMALLLLLVPEVKAVDLYNTMAQSQAGEESISIQYGNGLSFKTTATDYTVDTVQIPLKKDTATSGNITISIYDATGTSGLPGNIVGTSIGTVPVSSLTSSFQTFSFSGLNRTLSPSTNYYITVGSTDIASGVARGRVTNNNSGAITTGSLGYAFYNNQWTGPHNSFWYFGVVSTVASVPEPSTYALAAISTGVMATVARRRKARLG